ncbi:flagellar hook-associated protein FlgK [uncultured Mobiluncus sp.]|uniref:flagellar hook-associated protein FlgK n=1 Tax=uncultured Mobiluncus sp. TaxID=293425 RepID=UPI0025DDDDDF|nr:flagellar basal body rod C-terminal domain-containing protein [uncultured Mobiluncus sp.]
MGSTFSSLNAGLTGLYAAQRLIEVSGQNINNLNTPGYTRQRVEQRALGIGSEPSIFAGSVPQGGGVEVTGELRLGDFFLDAKLRLETGRAASTKQISKSWKAIEASMDELGKMSVSNSLRNFYKSWGDVNNSSDNRGARATAIGNAQALVTQIQTGYTHISDQWKNARHELEAHVSDLNTTMDSVVNLNDRIRRGTLMGQNVNHLIDERDKLALHISELTGATVRKSKAIYTKENAPHPSMIGTAYEDGTIEIMLSGNSLVGKDYANHFVVSGSYDMPGIDAAPREMYQKSVDALTAGGKRLDAVFTRNGVEIQKYQAKVSVYTTDDAPDPSKVGHKYVAFYDMENNGSKVSGTDQEFALGDFHRDEGPVRLTWDIGGHEIAIKEGVIGGIAQNLRPAEIPGVSGTIGKGGSWAEAGKLYNDVATNIATEVNAIHANDVAQGGKNNTKTLLTKEVKFKLADLSKDTTDPNRLADAGVTIKRSDYQTDELFDRAVQDKVAELEQSNPGHAAIYETVKEDGGDFFKFAATDNKLPAAMRLKVAITDPQAIAAGVEVGGIYDGSVALRLGGQQDAPTSALNEWGKSVVDIGVHASGASDKYTLAEQTRHIAEQQQKSQSSVDMNEEVMNLIRGQHAYAGAARITSTVNQMLETLINLGR